MRQLSHILRVFFYLLLSALPVIVVSTILYLAQLQDQNLSRAYQAEKKQRTTSAIKDVMQRGLISYLATQSFNNKTTLLEAVDSIEFGLTAIENNSEFDGQVLRDFRSKVTPSIQQLKGVGDHLKSASVAVNAILTIVLELDKNQGEHWGAFHRSTTMAAFSRTGMIWVLRILAIVMGVYFIYFLWLRVGKMESDQYLQKSEQLYQIMFNSLSEGVLTLGSENRILLGNSSASKILNVKNEHLRELELRELFPVVIERDGRSVSFENSSLSQISVKSRIQRNIVCGFVNHKKECVWLSFSSDIIPALHYFDEPACIVSFVDVSDEIKNQSALDEQRAHMLNMERLSAFGEVAAGIAHEILNPLAIIRGYAELLQKETGKQQPLELQKTKKFSEVIFTAVTRAMKIISSMKRLSREGTVDPCVEVNLKSIIDETLIFAQMRFKSSKVKLEVSDLEEIKISCREAQISQVILNLLNNACDAAVETEEKWVKLELISTNQEFVEIHVTDSGHGIKPEVQKKIFQPFFTTKEVGKGTGLGLSISRQIIDLHHGELFIDSSSPRTKFVIRLPRDPSQFEVQEAKKAA